MSPAATKSNLAIFSIKVTVKVTRPLNLGSFEKVSLVEYGFQLRSLYFLLFKRSAEVKAFTTDRQAYRTIT